MAWCRQAPQSCSKPSICGRHTRLVTHQNPIKKLAYLYSIFPESCPLYRMPVLVQIMAWFQSGDKPLSKKIMGLLILAYIRHSAWVDSSYSAPILSTIVTLFFFAVHMWTLLHSCRRAILQHINKHQIDELPLPTKLKKFLKYEMWIYRRLYHEWVITSLWDLITTCNPCSSFNCELLKSGLGIIITSHNFR